MQYYDGIFPTVYNDILSLKGVGDYTAAAISSFSFGLPYAVVDGNVVRVLSRFFGIDVPFQTTLGKIKYQQLAQDILDKKSPADNNQAIMDFGSMQCTPKAPKCEFCPLSSDCVAFNTNSIKKFPVRQKKSNVRRRYLNYLLIKNEHTIALDKRDVGIWKGLYEFPFIEHLTKRCDQQVMLSDEWMNFFKNIDYRIESISEEYIHKLSHQYICAKFWTVNVKKTCLQNHNFIKISTLKEYPVSRLTDKFLREHYMI